MLIQEHKSYSELEKGFMGILYLTPEADTLNYYNAYLCRINSLQNKAWKAILGG